MFSQGVIDPLNPGTRQYSDPRRSADCLKGFHNLFKEKTLCDVTLVVDGVEFLCHKVVLAASSEYFRLMFASSFVEREKDKITMSDIEPKCLEIIIEYLYTGSVNIDGENVQPLFFLAHMLQMEEVENMCVDYMYYNLTETNCLGVYCIGRKFEKEKLREYAKYKLFKSYSKIIDSPDFLELTAIDVAEILNFSYVPYLSEEDIYFAALRWVEHNLTKKSDSKIIYEAMKSVRFALLDENFFRKKVKNKPIFRHCMELQRIFEQVIYYFNHLGRWHELDLVLQPRMSQGQYRLILHCCQTVGICGYGSKFEPYGKGCVTYKNSGATFLYNQIESISKDIKYPTVGFHVDRWHGRVLVSTGVSDINMVGGYTNWGKRIGDGKGNYTGVRELSRANTTVKGYEWSNKLAPMSCARAVPVAVALDNTIYAIGGLIKNRAIQSVEKYNPIKNKWTKVSSLPYKLGYACGISYRGRIYVFGGEAQPKKKDSRHISKKTLCYDPERDKWHYLKDMKKTRALAGCAVYKNKIFVIGGMTELATDHIKDKDSGSATASVEMYDPATDSWSDGPPLPQELCAIGVAKYDGTVYCLGGMNKQGTSNKVHYLNEEGTAWLDGPTLPPTYKACIHSSCSPVTVSSHIIDNELASWEERSQNNFPWGEPDCSDIEDSDSYCAMHLHDHRYDSEMTSSTYGDSNDDSYWDLVF